MHQTGAIARVARAQVLHCSARPATAWWPPKPPIADNSMAIAVKSSEYTRFHAKSSHTNGAPPKKTSFFSRTHWHKWDFFDADDTVDWQRVAKTQQQELNLSQSHFFIIWCRGNKKDLAHLNALFSMKTYIHMRSLSKLPFLKITISPFLFLD